MNIFSELQNDIRDTVLSLDIVQGNESELALDRIVVEPPRDVSHGDLACNAALVLAKPLKISPRDLAGMLVEKLRDNADIADITIAGPGFINLTFQKGFWQRQLLAIFKAGRDFGRSEIGKGRRVNVEFVSANPTGPLHVGHGRGAVVGDVLANILSFAGFATVKEYYINDAGAQIDTLARSVMLRYREALGQPITEIPAGLYPGDYLVPVGASLAAEHGGKLLEMPESEALRIARDRAVSAMMDLIRSDLAAINVHHDVFFSEQSLHAGNGALLNKAIDDLTMKGYVYRGTLPRPKGHSGSNDAEDEWEDREQTLFKSTRAGDDIDRALFKSDGSFTYFAADLGYFFDKFKRGFDETIFVLGADHGGYVKRMEALAQAVSGGDVELSVLLCQLVRLFRNGEPIKMSKRSGDFITLSEVVDEVGPDAVRFMMIYRKSDAPLDFDFAKVTEQSRDNPVFYVQYAHARCHSIFRQAREALPGFDHASLSLDENGVAVLEDEGEILLIRKLSEYPRVIEGAAIAHEPHRLAFYLYELASVFHGHWNRGKENPRLRFVNPAERELSEARLGIVKAVASTIASGLDIIGAAAPEEMR